MCIADWLTGSSVPWLGHEHAVQQWHDDETAAEAEQHGRDACHAAEECQQEVEEHRASSVG
jgi:hypothetical protein